MVQDLIAGRKECKRKQTSYIVVEPYRRKRVQRDCCAWAGKAAGSIRLCLELFVTFCFKAKSKERKIKVKRNYHFGKRKERA
jgi:hypothetical protein